MNWKGYIAIAFLLALVIFVVQNYEVVEINFLFWTFKASRAIILFFTLAIGMILGSLGGNLRK